MLRESFEVSIMRENPLYESAGEIGQNSKVKSQIYTDMFSEPERKPDDNHQYVDIGDLRKQGTLNDTAEAANPLYATLVNSFTK